MNLRLLAAALGAIALFSPSFAQTPDLAIVARSSGTPDIPGLKMVWLAPWGDVARAHPWRNIIVHQTEGPAGSARGPTEAQVAAWRILVKVLRARYGIPLDRVYAHNWIDFKDARYCEGCTLAKMAREWGEQVD